MNEEEILFFLRNKQQYKQNNEEILQYRLTTKYYWSHEVLIKDDEKNFNKLKLQYKGKLKIGFLDELLEFYEQIIRKLSNIAKIYVQKRQYIYALQQYNKYIQINPFEYRFYHNKAYITSNLLNNLNKALKCYEQHCQIDYTNYKAHIEKAQLYQKLNNYQTALCCYLEYIKIDPNYHKKQQFQKAYQDCCNQSIQYDKTNHKINYFISIKKCQFHIFEHDQKIALQLYIEYMQQDKNYFQKADLVNAILECCNQCINFDKTYMIAYMTKSNVLCQQNQYLASINCYENYIQTNQNNLKNVYFLSILQCCDLFIDSDKQSYLPYLKKAQILEEKKDFTAALQCYDQYMQINVNYNQINDFFQALLKCYDQYINSEQQNYQLYIQKAQILEKNQDFKAAFQCYEQFLNIANEQFQHKDQFFQTFINCCDQYIAHNKLNHIPYLKKGLHTCKLLLAQILRQIGKRKEALDCYESCINNSNNKYEAMLNKGKILRECKEYREAILCFIECREMDPTINEPNEILEEMEDKACQIF